jgi:ubiquinone/menaquinone biosynthesis C-methylase UbiE
MISDSAPNQSPPRPTALAWMMLRDWIRPGDTVIDATAGNGHDTVFLAERVGPTGKVLAFDVQDAAIAASRLRVEEAGTAARVEFHRCSHALMGKFAEAGSVAAIMFNLGYLPGEDHDLTTTTSGTLSALEAAGRLLRPGGFLSVICYPGHEGGMEEACSVESWLTAKSSDHWRLAKYAMLGTRRPAPFLLIASKG